jgi:hypothetical protein
VPSRAKVKHSSGGVLSFCFAFKMSLIEVKPPRAIQLRGESDAFAVAGHPHLSDRWSRMATNANSSMSMARSVPWKASSTGWFAGRWIPNTMTVFLGEARAAHPDEFLLMAAGGGCSQVAKELVVPENIRLLRPAALCPGTQSPRTHPG